MIVSGKGGALGLVGNLSPTLDFPLQQAVTREITLYGSCASNGEYPACLDMIARGGIDVDSLISAVAPLSEGASWFERLYNARTGLDEGYSGAIIVMGNLMQYHIEGGMMADDFFDLTWESRARYRSIQGAWAILWTGFWPVRARTSLSQAVISNRWNRFGHEIEEMGRRAVAVELDVRDYDSIQRHGRQSMGRFTEQSIYLSITQGVMCVKPSTEITWDDWNLVLDTNLRGTFFVARSMAVRMIPRGYGRIINIGSVTSVFGYAGLAPYCASRGGTKQLTMSLADEWGPHGITVNCLAPGWFKTAQTAVMYEDKEWVSYLTDRIPVKRPGSPNDLDGAVVFLASEESRYVTGQTLLVDGGISTGATRAGAS